MGGTAMGGMVTIAAAGPAIGANGENRFESGILFSLGLLKTLERLVAVLRNVTRFFAAQAAILETTTIVVVLRHILDSSVTLRSTIA